MLSTYTVPVQWVVMATVYAFTASNWCTLTTPTSEIIHCESVINIILCCHCGLLLKFIFTVRNDTPLGRQPPGRHPHPWAGIPLGRGRQPPGHINPCRVAMAQGKQGIWFLLFPDRENTGNFVVTQGKIC